MGFCTKSVLIFCLLSRVVFVSKILSTPDYKLPLSKIKNDLDFQRMTTRKINKALRNSGELAPNNHIRKTNEKVDGLNTDKYKIKLIA